MPPPMRSTWDHVRISYADYSYYNPTTNAGLISNCQFVNDGWGAWTGGVAEP